MEIHQATFVKSSTKPSQLPEPEYPEYAFVGRSNVGKSSLINMLTGRNALAKISGKPGKTRTVNHFLIDESWYLADLPGYGYAKVSKKEREQFMRMMYEYLDKRENLMCVMLLIDSRIPPQKSDLEFMERLGTRQIPFVMVFTKIDKLSSSDINRKLEAYQEEMLKTWNSLPQIFPTSANTKVGREEVLTFIEDTNKSFTRAQ